MTTSIQLDRHGGLATVWLDRAAKRNALDGELMRALGAALDELGADPTVRVVILRGKGPVFSSGIDHALLLEEFQASQHAPFLHLHHQLQDTFDKQKI